MRLILFNRLQDLQPSHKGDPARPLRGSVMPSCRYGRDGWPDGNYPRGKGRDEDDLKVGGESGKVFEAIKVQDTRLVVTPDR
jgi:hypothetical protein